ncbi:MAG: hypothetical protein FWD62_05350 [Betaproteobacteria bacterium]|nr:hypothetical protein [Betaproteobacteria bacterium]
MTGDWVANLFVLFAVCAAAVVFSNAALVVVYAVWQRHERARHRFEAALEEREKNETYTRERE